MRRTHKSQPNRYSSITIPRMSANPLSANPLALYLHTYFMYPVSGSKYAADAASIHRALYVENIYAKGRDAERGKNAHFPSIPPLSSFSNPLPKSPALCCPFLVIQPEVARLILCDYTKSCRKIFTVIHIQTGLGSHSPPPLATTFYTLRRRRRLKEVSEGNREVCGIYKDFKRNHYTNDEKK